MKTFDIELFVGILIFLGIGVLTYLSLNLGRVDLVGEGGYTVQAVFTTVGGLQRGAAVELAGVQIGRVEKVELDNYRARVKLTIHTGISLYEDAKAAIKTKGLIGERYVEIAPGRGTNALGPGSQIRDTESPIDIQELIAKFIFGNVEQNSQSEDRP
jgi:phospholipid/cholesterol/gamma-HCH transport system substrate-binding protein